MLHDLPAMFQVITDQPVIKEHTLGQVVNRIGMKPVNLFPFIIKINGMGPLHYEIFRVQTRTVTCNQVHGFLRQQTSAQFGAGKACLVNNARAETFFLELNTCHGSGRASSNNQYVIALH